MAADPALIETPRRGSRGRWAPTPSGLLHVGSARTALAAWLSARSRGGGFVWRLEDLDPPRTVPGVAEAAIDDLRWLGLDWDEGPDVGGPFAPYEQSRRTRYYDDALRRLFVEGRLFPCRRSRRDLRELARAPHAGHGPPPYPPHLRPKEVPDDWFERFTDPERTSFDAAIRFRVDSRPARFEDLVLGPQQQRVDLEVGDFVLKRRDGLFAYQLSVVVDDLLMGVDEVVRGVDLLDSTGRQLQLIEALGGTPPAYAHVPLVLNADGEKISKRDGELTLESLRRDGVTPEALTGYLAHSLGLIERAEQCRPADLVAEFDWHRVRRENTRYAEADLPRGRASAGPAGLDKI